ncbi:hypothetical protein IQ243_13270 [Nostocales cyanobacterium LEGE 11386]|nr:hypothetical protein [Nostocales cyanobacterium LEGE 11386]
MIIKDLDFWEIAACADSIIGGISTSTDIQMSVAPGYADVTASAVGVGDSSNTFTKTNAIVDENDWARVSKATGIALATARDSKNFSLSYRQETMILITSKY